MGETTISLKKDDPDVSDERVQEAAGVVDEAVSPDQDRMEMQRAAEEALDEAGIEELSVLRIVRVK